MVRIIVDPEVQRLIDESQLLDEAIDKYIESETQKENCPQQPCRERSEVYDDRVVLENVNGVLANYGITEDGNVVRLRGADNDFPLRVEIVDGDNMN